MREGELVREDRDVLTEIFLSLLLQRFKTKSREEIRQMMAELTPLHETRAGKELLEEGVERGTAVLVLRMTGKCKSPAQISEWTDLPIEKVERLLASAAE